MLDCNMWCDCCEKNLQFLYTRLVSQMKTKLPKDNDYAKTNIKLIQWRNRKEGRKKGKKCRKTENKKNRKTDRKKKRKTENDTKKQQSQEDRVNPGNV